MAFRSWPASNGATRSPCHGPTHPCCSTPLWAASCQLQWEQLTSSSPPAWPSHVSNEESALSSLSHMSGSTSLPQQHQSSEIKQHFTSPSSSVRSFEASSASVLPPPPIVLDPVRLLNPLLCDWRFLFPSKQPPPPAEIPSALRMGLSGPLFRCSAAIWVDCSSSSKTLTLLQVVVRGQDSICMCLTNSLVSAIQQV